MGAELKAEIRSSTGWSVVRSTSALLSIGLSVAQGPALANTVSPKIPSAVVDARHLTHQTKNYASAKLAMPLVNGIATASADAGVEASQYPWQVQIGGFSSTNPPADSNRCGGILITSQFVLTAAHCLDSRPPDGGRFELIKEASRRVFGPNQIFGEGPGLQLDPEFGQDGVGVVVHPEYKSDKRNPYPYDAALFRLAKPLYAARPAPIRQEQIATGQQAIVSGWGMNHAGNSGLFSAALVSVTDHKTCTQAAGEWHSHRITAETLCTVDPTSAACKGDSGGPLVIGSRTAPQTIGVVSWGSFISCGKPPNAKLGLMTAFTRASSLVSWILEITGSDEAVTNKPPEELMPLVES